MGKAGEEEAGVDGAGDGWAGDDGGHDGHVEHLDHVAGGEGSLVLGDEDDAVWSRSCGGEDGGEGDVARASENRVAVAGGACGGCCGHGAVAALDAGVDHDELGLVRVGTGAEDEAVGHLHPLVVDGEWDADEGGGGGRIVAGEHRRLVLAGEQGDGGGDGCRALPAACAGDDDRAGHRVLPRAWW